VNLRRSDSFIERASQGMLRDYRGEEVLSLVSFWNYRVDQLGARECAELESGSVAELRKSAEILIESRWDLRNSLTTDCLI
jgi:hypothetical protein